MVTTVRTQTIPYESMLLGETLIRAGLISKAQIDFALYEQKNYVQQSLGQHFRLGDILVLRGWIAQTTTDFFALRWPLILMESSRQRLGEYLQEAGLLTQEQQDTLVREQGFNRMRLGTLAVLKGWLSQQTLDFFLAHLYPEEQRRGHWMQQNPGGRSNEPKDQSQTGDPQKTYIQKNDETDLQLWFEQSDEIPWFD